MKNIRFLIGAFLLLFLFVFLACHFHPDHHDKANTDKADAETADAGSNREYLAILKARGNHTVSYEVLVYERHL